MSIRAISQALDFADPNWSASVQLVAIAIADHVDAQWECWPSVPFVADRTRLSERRVQQIIRQLEREGVLTRTARFRDRRQVSNLYRWTMFLGTILNPGPDANLPVQNPVDIMGINAESSPQG